MASFAGKLKRAYMKAERKFDKYQDWKAERAEKSAQILASKTKEANAKAQYEEARTRVYRAQSKRPSPMAGLFGSGGMFGSGSGGRASSGGGFSYNPFETQSSRPVAKKKKSRQQVIIIRK